MKHTTINSYGVNPGWDGSGWTTVLQTNLTISQLGLLVLQFSTPFNYNGLDNLLIDFSFNNNFYTGDGTTRSTDTALNRSLYYRTDSGAGDPLTWSGTSPTPLVITRVPNVKLIGSQGTVALTPGQSGIFTGGIWTGNLTVQQVATNLVLRANDGDGHLGSSTAFNVLIHNDVSIALSDSPDPVPIGGQLTYTLTVTNTGPNAATGVIVSNILPASATYVSAVSSQGSPRIMRAWCAVTSELWPEAQVRRLPLWRVQLWSAASPIARPLAAWGQTLSRPTIVPWRSQPF